MGIFLPFCPSIRRADFVFKELPCKTGHLPKYLKKTLTPTPSRTEIHFSKEKSLTKNFLRHNFLKEKRKTTKLFVTDFKENPSFFFFSYDTTFYNSEIFYIVGSHTMKYSE